MIIDYTHKEKKNRKQKVTQPLSLCDKFSSIAMPYNKKVH